MRLEQAIVWEINEKLPDGDADGELIGNQSIITEQVTAARPGDAIQKGDMFR